MRINVQDLLENQPYTGTIDPLQLVCDQEALDEALEPTFTCDEILGQDREQVRLWRSLRYGLKEYGGPQARTELDSLRNDDFVRENHICGLPGEGELLSYFGDGMTDSQDDVATEHDAQEGDTAHGFETFASALERWTDQAVEQLITWEDRDRYIADFLLAHGSQIARRERWSLSHAGMIHREAISQLEKPSNAASAEDDAPVEHRFDDSADAAYSGAAVRKRRTHVVGDAGVTARLRDREEMLAAQRAVADLLCYADPLVFADGVPVLWPEPDVLDTMSLAEQLEHGVRANREHAVTLMAAREVAAVIWDEQSYVSAFAQEA